MYILTDGFTETVHSLGSRPLEAILAFCDHLKNGVGHPEVLRRYSAQAFEDSVTDGTETELFSIVERVSKRSMEAGHQWPGSSVTPFELRVVPRPPCRSCRFWQGHGAKCIASRNVQLSEIPCCEHWASRFTEWDDIDPAHRPKRVFEDGIDDRIHSFVASQGKPVTVDDIVQKFPWSNPDVVRSAVRLMVNNDYLNFDEDKQTVSYNPQAILGPLKYGINGYL